MNNMSGPKVHKKEIYLYQVTTYYQLPFNVFGMVKALTPLDYMETTKLIILYDLDA